MNESSEPQVEFDLDAHLAEALAAIKEAEEGITGYIRALGELRENVRGMEMELRAGVIERRNLRARADAQQRQIDALAAELENLRQREGSAGGP